MLTSTCPLPDCDRPLIGTRCPSCGDPARLEFECDLPGGGVRTWRSFDEAAGWAVACSASTGLPVYVDVLCWTRAAAHAFGCLEDYDADVDASVTKRVKVSAADLGRVA